MLCDIIENAQFEREQLVAQGLSQGLSQGQSQGELRKALEVAKAMLKEKLPVNLIAKVTKLTLEQVEAIEA